MKENGSMAQRNRLIRLIIDLVLIYYIFKTVKNNKQVNKQKIHHDKYFLPLGILQGKE